MAEAPSLLGVLTRIESRLKTVEESVASASVPHQGCLDTAGAAKFMSLSPKSLELWRQHGMGPPYIKFGRAVRYQIHELISFMERQKIAPLDGDE